MTVRSKRKWKLRLVFQGSLTIYAKDEYVVVITVDVVISDENRLSSNLPRQVRILIEVFENYVCPPLRRHTSHVQHIQ